MLTSEMFTTLTSDVTADLVTILPVAFALMATLWGLRIGISYLKGIAR